MKRPDWHEYFLTMAEAAAARSTCDRKHVGCVIVQQQRVVATGYNGSIPGQTHCDDAGHDMVKSLADDGSIFENCQRTVHAEQNAVAAAARNGIALHGAVAYVNTYPCWNCYKVLVSAGIAQIYYRDGYRIDVRVNDSKSGVPVIAWTP